MPMLCVKTESGPDVTFGNEDDTENWSGFCWALLSNIGQIN